MDEERPNTCRKVMIPEMPSTSKKEWKSLMKATVKEDSRYLYYLSTIGRVYPYNNRLNKKLFMVELSLTDITLEPSFIIHEVKNLKTGEKASPELSS